MEGSSMSNILGKAFKLGDDVNTDINCSSKYAPGKDSQFISTIAFEQLSPGFSNRLQQSQGGIIVAGEHFGINSSREQAIAVLHLMQVRCILAPSFGRQFFRNAINNGLAILECDTTQIQDGAQLNIDLQTGLVQVESKQTIQATLLPKEVLKIISMGGLIPFLNEHPDWNFQA
jgi:3-isopropylmalate/(R)-2-methylmalate dehydratase small subunit